MKEEEFKEMLENHLMSKLGYVPSGVKVQFYVVPTGESKERWKWISIGSEEGNEQFKN